MRASDAGLMAARARGGEIMGGDPRVEEWEVGVMHRDHQAPAGSCCRVTWLQLEDGDMDHLLTVFRTQVLPRFEALDGFCSASMLVDRITGRTCGTVAFESRAGLRGLARARRGDPQRRRERCRRVGGRRRSSSSSSIAHLRLPELV